MDDTEWIAFLRLYSANCRGEQKPSVRPGGSYSLTVQLPMSPTHVSATQLSVHDSSVPLHWMRTVSTDVAAMCMSLGNAGYAQPNTTAAAAAAAEILLTLPA